MLPDNAVRHKVFQSTHPARGATFNQTDLQLQSKISIHAPREGCDCIAERYKILCTRISIHAPREGCDFAAQCTEAPDEVISIHAPREGCDLRPM